VAATVEKTLPYLKNAVPAIKAGAVVVA